MDRIGAEFDMCVRMVSDRLGATPLVLQLPIGKEAELRGLVDLVRMKGVVWKDESLGADFEYIDIPADMADEAAEWREKLVEAAVEQDDAAMEAYLEGQEPDEDTLKACIRKATLSLQMVPVLCGSAFKNKGVQPLLNAVVDYLPSPVDVPDIRGVKPGTDEPLTRKSADDQPFAALAFKIMSDPFVGTLTFARVYSGTVESGQPVLNTEKKNRERVGRMLLMQANDRKDIKTGSASWRASEGQEVYISGVAGS